MNNRYITIEREYGSGGTEIARKLSARTGIPCYGREILDKVSEEQNIPVENIEKYEEKATNSLLYSVYLMSQTTTGNSDMLTKEGHIYLAEQEVIRRFARKGSAIFLGHCASEALKECDGVVKVFIKCSDANAKHQRIVDTYGVTSDEAEVVRRKFDKKRSNYYSINTEKKWRDFNEYDIVLDNAVIGTEGCVNLLEGLLK